jgi:hypothetical protein
MMLDVFSERQTFFDEAGHGLFLTRLETYFRSSKLASHCNKTWIGRVDLIEPGQQ